MAKRADSWINFLTGLGDSMRDKIQSTIFRAQVRQSDTTLENLFCGNAVAARICEALPQAALRNGFYVSAEESDPDLATALSMYCKRTGFSSALRKAAIWARLFGGSAIYVVADDGQMQDSPLGETVRTIKKCVAIDRRWLFPKTYYETDERYGETETYEVQRTVGGLTLKETIHESRLIRFDGVEVPETRRQTNNGWGDSVLERPYEEIRDFGTSWQAVAHLLSDAAQGKFKIQGLHEMILAGNQEAIQARMQVVEMSRSVARAIALDAENEDYTRDAYSFTGIPDVLRLFMLRLAGAARMPVTILMGQSPQGMDATGEGDTRVWYDEVRAYQNDTLFDAIELFYRLVFKADDFEAEEPEGWEVRFGRLWQMSDKEQAELEKLVAERDAIYIDKGVLMPEEVASNRFRVGGFSADTQIDLDIREELLEAEQKKAIETKDDPDPEPPVVPDDRPGEEKT